MITVKDHAWERMAKEGSLGGFPVVFLAATGSTNEDAMGFAEDGAEAYKVVVAETQTGGRGRLGKSWQSPPGTGLYFSVILRPALQPEDLPKITLAAGVATAKAIEGATNTSIGIKWPNDLILAGRKLGGILCETSGKQAAEGPVVILGVGVNINTPRQAFPADLKDKATSLLSENGIDYCRSDLLQAILEEIKKIITLFERDGFAPILSEWRLRDVTLGRELSWLVQAGEVVRGISMGPDDRGQLLIRDHDGHLHEVLSGDIDLLTKG